MDELREVDAAFDALVCWIAKRALQGVAILLLGYCVGWLVMVFAAAVVAAGSWLVG